MDYQFRPLVVWPFENTKSRRSHWTFKATWGQTLRLLESELSHLRAKDVIFQADFREQDLRLDGMPRSGARQPEHPGIIISFESKHGPLQYASDSCIFWEHNIRSVALGLGALRAVDRYGITRTGEQYTGWKALNAGAPIELGAAAFFSSKDEAADFIGECAGWNIPPDGMDPEVVKIAYRAAVKKVHPDKGGDVEVFNKLVAALEMIEK